MTVMMRLLTFLVPFFLMLPGCTALTALDEASTPLEIYELQTPDLPRSAARRPVELVVLEPTASGALATERIMIRPAPLKAQYLPGVRWADSATVLLQTLMVRSLTEIGAFRSVGRNPVGTVSDFTILSELTDFQADTVDDGDRAVVRTRLVVRLIRESDSTVIATKAFAVSEIAEATDADTLTAAFNRATSRLLAEVAAWVVQRTTSS